METPSYLDRYLSKNWKGVSPESLNKNLDSSVIVRHVLDNLHITVPRQRMSVNHHKYFTAMPLFKSID